MFKDRHEPWERLGKVGIEPNGEHAMEPIEDTVMAMYREMFESGQLAGRAAEKN